MINGKLVTDVPRVNIPVAMNLARLLPGSHVATLPLPSPVDRSGNACQFTSVRITIGGGYYANAYVLVDCLSGVFVLWYDWSGEICSVSTRSPGIMR